MSNVGDQTPPNATQDAAQPHTATPKGPIRSIERLLADRLLDRGHIGSFVDRRTKHPRYLKLESQAIFDALVNLYALNFQANWKHLKPLVYNHQSPLGYSGHKYLATVYISHWFIDLYCSIRDACDRLETLSPSLLYQYKFRKQSNVYDAYLALLNAAIRPTHIVGLPEDALYIPIISDPIYVTHVQNYNHFRLTGFIYNEDVFGALIAVMSDPLHPWRMAPLVTDAYGRPTWLFDWHKLDAYAWFPEEGNYNDDDVNLSFILGVSCTPHLAPRDEDYMQQFSDDFPESCEPPSDLARSQPKRFYSNIDRRVIMRHELPFEFKVPSKPRKDKQPADTASSTDRTTEGQTQQLDSMAIVLAEASAGPTDPAGAKRKQPSDPPEPTVDTICTSMRLWNIVDYKYYHQVIRKSDINTRSAAHKILITKEK